MMPQNQHALRWNLRRWTLGLAMAAVALTGSAASAQEQANGQEASAAPASEQVMELTLGQSELVTPPWPVKRVSVTDPNIADVQVLSPRRIQVVGKSSGITEVMMWSEDEELWQAKVQVGEDVTRIAEQIRRMFPRSRVRVDQVGETLVLRGQLGRRDQVEQLGQFMQALEKPYIDMTSVAGVQQVQLKVHVAEVSRQALRTLGVNTFHSTDDFFGGIPIGSSAGPGVPINIGVPEGTAVGGVGESFETLGEIGVPGSVTIFGGFPSADLEVFISALNEDQYLRTLAEPNLVAMSGETATFLAGGEVPIPIAQLGEGGTTAISIEYREFGVQLAFVPEVLGDGSIRLMVAPEVSELSDVGAVQVLGTRVPSFLTRRVQTTLELKSGQSFAIAGLISRDTNARASEIPGLGRLPVLGSLFRSVRYLEEETELMILVTAHLVEPLSADLASIPTPGTLHNRPDAWEFYAMGRIEGRTPAKLSPRHSAALRDIGLDQLKGPGAWVSYEPMSSQRLDAESDPSE